MTEQTCRDESLEKMSNISSQSNIKRMLEPHREDLVSEIVIDEIQETFTSFSQESSRPTKNIPRGTSSEQVQTEKEQIAQRHPPSLNTISDGKPFADLVRTFETYIGDSAIDQLQPLLHNVCGSAQYLSRLGALETPWSSTEAADPRRGLSETVPLRSIHSTPLVHIPSIVDDDDDVGDEPPIFGLDILSRSRSTPLSTSANSAFGTISRLQQPYIGPDDRSAFTLPPYRLKHSSSEQIVSAHHTSFNPNTYGNGLELTEYTAIEVVDQFHFESGSVGEFGPCTVASRAARFLPGVRNFRRRRKVRNGRENPARPPSASDEPRKKSETLADEEISLGSFTQSCERTHNAAAHGEENGAEKNERDENTFDSPLPCTTIYHTLDSPETTGISSHQKARDENKIGRVRIQVSTTEDSSVVSAERLSYAAASPETCHYTLDPNTLTPQSQYSPETSRSSSTTFTSGHTTQATATTYSSGQISNLSVITETDLEVMQANKAGTILRSQGVQPGRVAPVFSSMQPRYPGYIEVSEGPSSFRDGASVPVERFFTLAESPNDKRVFGARLRGAASLRRSTSVCSPNTLSCSSVTTNSSTSSQDEPPTFVSYLDRKMESDLTSLRETDERSSPREDCRKREERELSPAELGYSDVIFEKAQAPQTGTQAKPRPIWPTKGFQFGRKVRSLPPRSPHKGSMTPTTPPPRGGVVSPACETVSPPRYIVDHQIDPNVTRPFVLRSIPPPTRLLSHRRVSPEVLSSYGNANYAHIPDSNTDQGAYEVVRIGDDFDPRSHYVVTQSRGSSPKAYKEQSIEILKTDSKEESGPTFVTPVDGSPN